MYNNTLYIITMYIPLENNTCLKNSADSTALPQAFNLFKKKKAIYLQNAIK